MEMPESDILDLIKRMREDGDAGQMKIANEIQQALAIEKGRNE